MRPIEPFLTSANEGSVAPAFVNGFTDGQAARASNARLTAYLRVGIDDYAKGFRAGFFSRAGAAALSDRSAPLHAVNM
ncbi:MAG: hypothetical protein EHM59_10375 [Betaproteobacteria bacterium]|nr:MAG: hypothetical protein EHM59_10375 [Betaproteobacteria bacterium]